MEIDSNYNLIEKNKNFENIFKLDYKEQNLNNNLNFIKWKNEMLEKYGRDAKLFKCVKDNLFFYVSNRDTKGDHLHLGKCPQCQRFICFFCTREGYIKIKHIAVFQEKYAIYFLIKN